MLPVEVCHSRYDISNNIGIHPMHTYLNGLSVCSKRFMNDGSHTKSWISNGAIIETILMSQCLGLTDFVDVEKLSQDSLCKNIIGDTISQETARQRLNQLSNNPDFFNGVDDSIAKILSDAKMDPINVNGQEMLTLDIDVTPFSNPKAKKEGIECTYKKEYGFAPIMGYINHYAIAFELRKGSQHSENGGPEFLLHCCSILKSAGVELNSVLLRVDSGHDDAKFMITSESENLNYLVCRNFRSHGKSSEAYEYAVNNIPPVKVEVEENGEEKVYNIYRYVRKDEKPTNAPDSNAYAVYEIRELIKGKLPVDQYSLVKIANPNCKEIGDAPSAIEVSSWWTNLDMSPKFIEDFKKSQKIRKNSSLNQQQSAACEHAFVAHLVE